MLILQSSIILIRHNYFYFIHASYLQHKICHSGFLSLLHLSHMLLSPPCITHALVPRGHSLLSFLPLSASLLQLSHTLSRALCSLVLSVSLAPLCSVSCCPHFSCPFVRLALLLSLSLSWCLVPSYLHNEPKAERVSHRIAEGERDDNYKLCALGTITGFCLK